MTDEREALIAVDKALRWTGRRESVRNMPDLAKKMEAVLAEEKAAVHAYAAAERLLEHVKMCRQKRLGGGGYATNSLTESSCGDGWYCPKALIKV